MSLSVTGSSRAWGCAIEGSETECTIQVAVHARYKSGLPRCALCEPSSFALALHHHLLPPSSPFAAPCKGQPCQMQNPNIVCSCLSLSSPFLYLLPGCRVICAPPPSITAITHTNIFTTHSRFARNNPNAHRCLFHRCLASCPWS